MYGSRGVYRRYNHQPHLRPRPWLIRPETSALSGDRYIVASPATGLWTGHEGEIAEFNGSSWDFTTPEEGYTIYVEDEDTYYFYDGTEWKVDLLSQYALLTGRTGGQTLIGGDGANDGLHLRGSSHASPVGAFVILKSGDNFSVPAELILGAGNIFLEGASLSFNTANESANFTVHGASDYSLRILGNNGYVGLGLANPTSPLHIASLATEALEIVDAGSASATEQDWIEVEVGGVTGYIRVFATK